MSKGQKYPCGPDSWKPSARKFLSKILNNEGCRTHDLDWSKINADKNKADKKFFKSQFVWYKPWTWLIAPIVYIGVSKFGDKPFKVAQKKSKKESEKMANVFDRTPKEIFIHGRMLQIAFEEMNTKEIPGKNHNPRIIQYHKTTTLKATKDEIAWCSALMNWLVIKAGFIGTNNALAMSWLDYGIAINKPFPGCIAVFRGGDHVALYLYETNRYIYVIGGNQGDKVSIIGIDKRRLAGYRTVI